VAAAVLATERGVALVRSHDVAPTVRALALVAAARRLAERSPSGPAPTEFLEADD
jgi:dihydropteroate synthase